MFEHYLQRQVSRMQHQVGLRLKFVSTVTRRVRTAAFSISTAFSHLRLSHRARALRALAFLPTRTVPSLVHGLNAEC